MIKTGEVAEFCNPGDGDGELDAAQDLSGVDDGIQAPRRHLVLEFLLQALKAFRDRVDRANVFLEDDVLGRCGADDLREPSERGGTPMGTTGIADIVA
jgi:hypothetical protein